MYLVQWNMWYNSSILSPNVDPELSLSEVQKLIHWTETTALLFHLIKTQVSI